MMRKAGEKGAKVFENKRCYKRELGKFLWKLFVLVQFVLPALIKFVAKVACFRGLWLHPTFILSKGQVVERRKVAEKR